MINLFKITITHKKEKWNIFSEVLAPTKEKAEGERYYQTKALRNKGYDTSLDKWDVDKFTFKAELIKTISE